MRKPIPILLLVLLVFNATSVCQDAGNPVRLLFFPLEDKTGNPDLAWLSEGLAISISVQITGPGIEASEPGIQGSGAKEQSSIGMALSRARMISLAEAAWESTA